MPKGAEMGATYLEKDDGSKGRMDVHEFGEIGYEATGDEVLDHELDKASGGLQTLESGKRRTASVCGSRWIPMRGQHAAGHPSQAGRNPAATATREEKLTPANSSSGFIALRLDLSCIPQQQMTRRQ